MMTTTHKILYQSAQNMKDIQNESVALVVTSPPYPMIEMWDEIFSNQNPEIRTALENKDGEKAFFLMHNELKKVWQEVFRVLIPGGIACINIGDAVRTIDKNFQLFPSHSKIIEIFHELGFQSLPEILWRKQTNAPNKFMGSGMLPPGAYVTLEHEFILIFRKGRKREPDSESEKVLRRESAYFWEERNIWFSDVWDFKGISQNVNGNGNKTRERSAAYPFELAFRLINMFSMKNDIILDPFLGTGTTTIAAITSERNSIGIEIDSNFKEIINSNIENIRNFANNVIQNRLKSHIEYISNRIKEHGPTKYNNEIFHFPVMTNQELSCYIKEVHNIIKKNDSEYEIEYAQIDTSNFQIPFIAEEKIENNDLKSQPILEKTEFKDLTDKKKKNLESWMNVSK